MSICLIRTRQPWDDAVIREHTEAHIESGLKRGDEWLLNRVLQGEAKDLLPEGFDTSGAYAFMEHKYMPLALSAGQRGDQLKELNNHLKQLIAIQSDLQGFARLNELLTGDNPPPEKVEGMGGEQVDNPVRVAAEADRTAAEARLKAVIADDWRWVAQRIAGAEIADQLELNLAVIRILPTIGLLNSFVEGEELGTVDARFKLESERQRIIDELTPAPEDDADVV